MFEIRGRRVELPAVVAVLGLEANRHRRLPQPGVIISPGPEIPIDRGLRQHARWGPDQSSRGLHAVIDEDLERAVGREMAALVVGRANLECGDDLAIPLHVIAFDLPWLALIPPVQRSRPELIAERAIDSVRGNAMQVGAVLDQMQALLRVLLQTLS